MDRVIAGILILAALIAGFFLFFPPLPTADTSDVPPIDVLDYQLFEGKLLPPSKAYHSISECTNLSYADLQDCRRQIAVKTNDASVCDALAPDDVDWCKAKVFVNRNDATACATLASNAANQCYYDLARQSNTETHCQSINLRSLRDDCLRDVAFKTDDAGICNAIAKTSIKDDCLVRVLLSRDNPNPPDCQSIIESDARDDCYYGVALILNETQWCQSIADDAWRANCMADIPNPPFE